MEKYITIVSLKPPKSEFENTKLYIKKDDGWGIGAQNLTINWEPDMASSGPYIYATWDELMNLQISEEDIIRYADIFSNRQIGYITRGEWQ